MLFLDVLGKKSNGEVCDINFKLLFLVSLVWLRVNSTETETSNSSLSGRGSFETIPNLSTSFTRIKNFCP